jgi:adenine-specific DNA methylase
MNFKDQESPTKLRGGFYTPSLVATFLAKWVLGKRPFTILEPGCGDGVFVKALQSCLRHSLRITGIELHAEEAEKARTSASGDRSFEAEIITDDFLEWALKAIQDQVAFDAVLGNPPYIRYQYLDARDQKFSEAIFSHFNLPFTKHTNAWVPFVIASIGLLIPGGRLAMVIPSEILHVLHAGSLRKFLLSSCSRILLIDPTELLFEEALQGTILLLLEKKESPSQKAAGVCVLSETNNDFLRHDPETIFNEAEYISGEFLTGKWMKVLLSSEEIELIERIRQMPTMHRFGDVASVDVGIVTGANKFFLVDDATVNEYGLEEFAKPMFGRSEHCPGIIYDSKVHEGNRTRGLPTNFLMFGNMARSRLPASVRRYIQLGEKQGLPERYKCRIRTPWYSVPSVYATPIGMLKRSHNYPRLILNSIEAYTTDTAYRLRSIMPSLASEALVYVFINSLTALTAELEGRHYGGGVLELVPSEIEKLIIPVGETSRYDLAELDQRIRTGQDPDALLSAQDDVVLKAAGLKTSEIGMIHEAWRRIRSRRHRLISDT